jgi:hypothetical protein
VRKPNNLATDNRLGMEFTTTYTPKRNWRLTWNLNLFQQALHGDFSFINSNNELIVQDFDTHNFTWFTNFNSKIPLLGAIDFQTIIFYSGRQIDAQSVNKGILSTNLAFSKDVIRDKATLSLNISDLFNSRVRRRDITTTNVNTYNEFQWQERQFTLSFLYRFNQPNGSNRENRNNNPGGGQNDFEA